MIVMKGDHDGSREPSWHAQAEPAKRSRFSLQPRGAGRIWRALETLPAKKGCRVASLTLPDSRRWKCPK